MKKKRLILIISLVIIISIVFFNLVSSQVIIGRDIKDFSGVVIQDNSATPSSSSTSNSSVLELYNITTFDFHATSDTVSGIFDTQTGDLIQIFARGIVTDGSTTADTQLFLDNVMVDFMERSGAVTRTFWLEYNFYEDSGTSINVSINTTSPATVNMDDIKIIVMKYHNTTISGGSSGTDTTRWNYFGGIGTWGSSVPFGQCRGTYGDQYIGLGQRIVEQKGNYPMRAKANGIIDYATFMETVTTGYNTSGLVTESKLNHTILVGGTRYYLGEINYDGAGQSNMANYTGLSISYSAGDLIIPYYEWELYNSTGPYVSANQFCYQDVVVWMEGTG